MKMLWYSFKIKLHLSHNPLTKHLSMHLSVVVAVSEILLLFHLFSFVFYCETAARASVATLRNN